MKHYIAETSQTVIAADITLDGSEYYLSTAANPELPAGTIVLEKDNPDSPRYQVRAGAAQAAGGPWLTPVELLMREYCVMYSFITFTHSTISGSMTQKAETKEAAISLARDWLTRIYQPVEFDYVTV